MGIRLGRRSCGKAAISGPDGGQPCVKRYGEARNAVVSDSPEVLQVAPDRRNVFEQLIEAVKYNRFSPRCAVVLGAR